MNSSMIIISFIFFAGLVAVITYFKTRNDNMETSDGYFLGGRSLTAIVVAGSLMLTNLSAVQFVGQSANAYRNNLSVIGWEAGSGIVLVFVALVLLPRYLKQGLTTIPEFVESRYDASTKNLITMLILLGYIINMLPGTLYAGAVALSQIFDIQGMFHITYGQGIWIMVWLIGIIGCCYAICGGLKAVAVSDTINGVILLIGGFSVVICALLTLGKGHFVDGVQNFLNMTPEKLNSIGGPNDDVPFGTMFTGMLIANIFYWGTDQSVIQRGLGAKNLKEGQKGLMLAGLMKVFTPIIIILPGVMGYQLLGGNISNAETVYPTLVRTVLPVPLAGVFAAAMFGAVLSTFNSVLNSSATLFAVNIYKPKWGKNKSEKDLVKVGRIFSVVMGIFSMVVAPLFMYAPQGLYNFFQSINLLYNIPVLIVIAVGYLTKKMPAIAGKIGVCVYMIGYVICYFIKPMHYLYYTTLLFIISCLVMFFIAKKYPCEEYEFENNHVVNVDPWKNRYRFGGFVTWTMIAVYIAFSPIGFVRSQGPTVYTFVAMALAAILIGVIVKILEKRSDNKK